MATPHSFFKSQIGKARMEIKRKAPVKRKREGVKAEV